MHVKKIIKKYSTLGKGSSSNYKPVHKNLYLVRLTVTYKCILNLTPKLVISCTYEVVVVINGNIICFDV